MRRYSFPLHQATKKCTASSRVPTASPSGRADRNNRVTIACKPLRYIMKGVVFFDSFSVSPGEFVTNRRIFPSEMQISKGEAIVDIYTYMFFTYGLTAVISLLMAGLIVIVNRLTSRI